MIFIHSLPTPVREAVEAGHAVVMGGAIRSHFEGVTPNDVDVFIFDECVYKLLVSSTQAVPVEGAEGCIHKIPGVIPVDLVYAEGITVADIHLLGDFDIACGIYCLGEFTLPENFEAQVKARKMRFLRTSSPELSYNRFLKYSLMGYQIDESIMELIRLWRAEAK